MPRDVCIPVGELAAFASHELPASRLRHVESHLGACAECRAALHAVLPTELPATGAASAAPPDAGDAALPPGTVIGRFILGSLLGTGGMGVVYAARDPELNRDVAIKILRGRPGGEAMLEARMRREAQAMARLSHPNVLPIFDVGMYDGRLSVAMELVEGGTLREWLAKEKRTVAQIVDAFVKAGSGLAAAHAAGLVHRDFKPDNVLVGKDGQVRVTDFGLARFAGAPSESDPDQAVPAARDGGSGSDAITRTGTVLGTPAYMSPEQLRGEPADARTDQFSFCVALYEALAGVRPLAAGGRGITVALSDPRAPRDGIGRIPRWLRKPLLRGLSLLPSARYPDMAPLLAALRAGPPVRRRTLAVSAIVVLGVVTASVARDRRARVVECQLAGERAGSAWSPADHDAVAKAFTSTGRPSAEDTFRRTSAALDAYSAQWSAAAVAACKNKTADAASGDLSVKRATCFDARLGALQAFVGVLRRADGETLDRAVQGARALPSIETCVGKDPLQGEPVPNDLAVRKAAGAAEQALAEASALRTAGRFAESLAAATKVLPEAERIGFPPLHAHALLTLAEAQEGAGDVAAAEQTYRRAGLMAEQAGAWTTAARALIGEAWRAAIRGDSDRAEERFDHAGVWVERAGDEDPLRGELLLHRARELGERGKYDEARASASQALALFERAGSDEATAAIAELGIIADYAGRRDDARGYYQRALERYERTLGPDSLKSAAVLENLGLMEGDEGDRDAAVRDVSRALAIEERALGPEHPTTATTMTNLSGQLNWANRPAESLALAQRAVAITEKAFGPDAADVGYALVNEANALLELHRYEDALAPAERALAIRLRGGATPLVLADAQADVGIALLSAGRDKTRGRALLVKAREVFVAEGREERLPEIRALIGGGAP